MLKNSHNSTHRSSTLTTTQNLTSFSGKAEKNSLLHCPQSMYSTQPSSVKTSSTIMKPSIPNTINVIISDKQGIEVSKSCYKEKDKPSFFEIKFKCMNQPLLTELILEFNEMFIVLMNNGISLDYYSTIFKPKILMKN